MNQLGRLRLRSPPGSYRPYRFVCNHHPREFTSIDLVECPLELTKHHLKRAASVAFDRMLPHAEHWRQPVPQSSPEFAVYQLVILMEQIAALGMAN